MNTEFFLIHIDILGFEKLPKDLAKITSINEDWIRGTVILKPFNEIIKEIREDNKINTQINVIAEGTDNCLLTVSSLNSIFEVLHKILNISIPAIDSTNTKTIPFEIAIDCVEEKNNSDNPITQKEVIASLKNDIHAKYKKWYKKESHKSITESYIAISNAVYLKLENYQKLDCIPVVFDNEIIYSLPISSIKREVEISYFLEKIGKSRNDASGALIDKVFIPPLEYENILRSFEKDHIIFITGTPGYGKTYLAIRLLWLWYKKGYSPIWIKGGDINERSEGRKYLEAIDANKDQNQIIYVEDPFGSIEYEKREKLSQGINEIISHIQKEKDIFLLLTSRKDIFEEFKKDSLSDEEIENFEKELNLKMPSYDTHKRKSILNKWAIIKDCKWYKLPKLKKHVLSLIEKEEILPTPLSIRNFIQNTMDIQNIDDINKEIIKNSESSEKNFAKEIIGLYHSGRKDRVLLLSFILIYENIDINYVKSQYNLLKEENYEDFSKILSEEYRLTENIPGTEYLVFNLPEFKGIGLTFSHPSYRAAIPIILKDPGCNTVFCKALNQLSKELESVPNVIYTLNCYFENIPNDIRNKLIFNIYHNHLKKKVEEYASNSSSEEYEIYIEQFLELLISHYEKLDSINQKLLIDLMETDSLRDNILPLISEDYPNHSLEIKEIFKKYIMLPEYLESALIAFCADYEKFPQDIHQKFFEIISNKKLMESGDNALIAASIIVEFYENIPKGPDAQLLLLLSNYSKAASEVSWAIYDYFDVIPSKIMNKIIKNITNNDEAIYYLSEILIHHYLNLPKTLRNKILKKVLEYDLPDYFYINMEKNYFSEIPDDFKDEILINIPFDSNLTELNEI